jgi:hypothetical protein
MDAIAQFADVVVDKLAVGELPLQATRYARLEDADLLDEFAARSLDLLALPAALATNIRVLEGEVELPKQRWSTSRIGDGQVIHTELRNPHIDHSVVEGGMVVIDSVDEVDLALMRLREAIEYRLSARAWINLYMTAGGTSNFGLHYDTFDTVIIQLLGQKLWMVGDRSQPKGAVIGPADHYDLRPVELTPGDLLVMPARALHNATGLGVFTMHLTIGFDRTAAVPFMLDEIDTVVGRTSAPLTEDELGRAKARITERRRGTSLPFAVSGQFAARTLIRWASRSRPVADEEADGTLHVTSGSRALAFTDIDAAVVRVLIAGDEHTVDDLVCSLGIPREAVDRIVRDLAALDLVICRFVRC